MRYQSFLLKQGPWTALEIANNLECELVGDGDAIIKNLATLKHATSNDISFYSNPKYIKDLENTRAAACIMQPKYQYAAPKGMALLLADNPYLTYAKLAEKLFVIAQAASHIAPTAYVDAHAQVGENCVVEAGAYIHESAKIGNNCRISANAVIGRGVQISDNCFIGSNTTLYYCDVGKSCIIHHSVQIGQDGFGFANSDGKLIKIMQLGGVSIASNVEIGANTCIDRGTIEDTIIGEGTKIDNLVQIGHNVEIGKHCTIIAQTGVAGSAIIGDYVTIGGQAGIAGHVKIGDKAMIAAQTGVMRNVKSKDILSGSPAVNIHQWRRQCVTLEKLSKKGKTNE